MSPQLPRVVITGIGVVSPFGVGREAFWACARAGASGVRAITEFDASRFACRVAAPVPAVTDDDLPAFVREAHGGRGGSGVRADPRHYSKAARIGVMAAVEAWEDAGLAIGEPSAGVIIGSGAGGIDVGERQYEAFFGAAWTQVTPYAIPVSIVGMVSSEISIALGLHGISHVLSTGCTSSTDALGYGLSLLRAGEAEVLLSGGMDACVTPGMIYGFSRMRVVSTGFNARRRGLAALRRAARRLRARRGRVDVRHRARGPGAGPRRQGLRGHGGIRLDLRRLPPRADGPRRRADPAGNAPGYRTLGPRDRGDRLRELPRHVHAAQRRRGGALRAPGVRRARRPVAGSSVKSMIGHPQGASGAAGIVTAALALERGFLPPTINQVEADPACDLDVIPNQGRAAAPAAALCNCLGFGSKNSAVVLGAVP